MITSFFEFQGIYTSVIDLLITKVWKVTDDFTALLLLGFYGGQEMVSANYGGVVGNDVQ